MELRYVRVKCREGLTRRQRRRGDGVRDVGAESNNKRARRPNRGRSARAKPMVTGNDNNHRVTRVICSLVVVVVAAAVIGRCVPNGNARTNGSTTRRPATCPTVAFGAPRRPSAPPRLTVRYCRTRPSRNRVRYQRRPLSARRLVVSP